MKLDRLLLGGIALLALAAAATLLVGQLAASTWLAAVLVWGSLPLGALPILMVHGLTGGRWGEQGRPLLLAVLATLPLLVAALLPLLLGLPALFAWTLPAEELSHLVRNKLAYLNPTFFILRTLAYCALWLWLAYLLSARRDRGEGVHAAGLVLWLLAVTFFSFDWFMSLEPEFYSDVYGLMLGASMVAAAFAWILLLGAREMEAAARRDLANIWLGVLLSWVLFAYSQYIVVWSANLPDEILWYIHRSAGLWRPVSVVSFGLFFLLPFLILLSGHAKGRPGWLMLAAASCLLGHVLQIGWLLLPAFDHDGLWQLLLLILLTALSGALFFALYRRRHRDQGRAAREVGYG